MPKDAQYYRDYRKRRANGPIVEGGPVADPVHMETAIDVHIPLPDNDPGQVWQTDPFDPLRAELVEAQRRIIELEEEVQWLKRKQSSSGKTGTTSSAKSSGSKNSFEYSDWLKELPPQDREYFEKRLK